MKVVEPFIGKPMTVDGIVLDVTDRRLFFDGKGAFPPVIIGFDEDGASRFHQLSKGGRVSIRGEMASFDRCTVRLSRCEIV
jgi:hypothetical protein